jgi:hypothetical protein
MKPVEPTLDTIVTVRLLPRDRQDTLMGYVFSDTEHARKWLMQRFVKRDAYRLEKVEVGPRHECRFCGGSGFRQTVKPIGKITVKEFLGDVL